MNYCEDIYELYDRLDELQERLSDGDEEVKFEIGEICDAIYRAERYRAA